MPPLQADLPAGLQEKQQTPLHLAARFGHCDVAMALLAAGALVDALTKARPLGRAHSKGHCQPAQTLPDPVWEITIASDEVGSSFNKTKGGLRSLACFAWHNLAKQSPSAPRKNDLYKPSCDDSVLNPKRGARCAGRAYIRMYSWSLRAQMRQMRPLLGACTAARNHGPACRPG